MEAARKATSGLEHEVFDSRNIHKYLKNNRSLVKFAKRSANKRARAAAKKQIQNA